MTLELLEVAPVSEERYRLTLKVNSRKSRSVVSYQEEMFPLLVVDSGDPLRPLLINNPRASQPIIEAIQALRAGRILTLPVALPVWNEETAQDEAIAA